MRYHHCQKLSGCNDYILQLNEALQVDPHSKKLLDLKRKWKDNEYRDDWEGYEDKKRSRKADVNFFYLSLRNWCSTYKANIFE